MVEPYSTVLLATKVKIDIFKLLFNKAHRVYFLFLFRGDHDVLSWVKSNTRERGGAEGNLEYLFKVVQDIEAKNLSCL